MNDFRTGCWSSSSMVDQGALVEQQRGCVTSVVLRHADMALYEAKAEGKWNFPTLTLTDSGKNQKIFGLDLLCRRRLVRIAAEEKIYRKIIVRNLL